MRRIRLRRARPFLVASVVLAAVVGIGLRERRQAGIRQTRATLLDVRRAMDEYLAEHDGNCPPGLSALSDYGSFKGAPRDAWGRPLRLICPGRRDELRYELFSDGPDGRPGGLDRID